MEARVNGKQVAVLLELKARFDEENNIEWARKLEDEGIHVVYGVFGLKTHAKMCLVIRRDEDSIRRYVHLGTGNYNPVTSRMYTDLSFLTCDQAMGADVADLFNCVNRLLPEEFLCQTARGAPIDAGTNSGADRAGDSTAQGTWRRVPGVQDERPRGHTMYSSPLPGGPSRCHNRPSGSGGLRASPGDSRHQ